MLRKSLLLLATAFLILGCASIEDTAQPYMKRNISRLVDKLGYPTDKREMLGQTLYRWRTGNRRDYYCDLDVGVDKNDVVKTINWDGNNGGCEALASRLK